MHILKPFLCLLHEFFEEFDQGMRLGTADYIEYTGEGVIECRLDYVVCIIVKCSAIFEPQWPANLSNLKGCASARIQQGVKWLPRNSPQILILHLG